LFKVDGVSKKLLDSFHIGLLAGLRIIQKSGLGL
jgi:hypothetical protein